MDFESEETTVLVDSEFWSVKTVIFLAMKCYRHAPVRL